MFKTDSFLGNKKLSLNQNVWRDHATMQHDVLLHFGVIFLIEIRLKYEFNSAFIVFLGIQYVVPALLAYTSRKATAKAIGIGVTNHHRSWFKSTFWVILVNFWAIGCIVLVTWNHIQSAINKGQL